MQLLAGHPYLIQQALYNLARKTQTLAQLMQTSVTDAGIYCHLKFKIQNFTQKAGNF